MRKQEIEGQLELDLLTGMVKETLKKKAATLKKGTKKTLKADILVDAGGKENDFISGVVSSKASAENTASVDEIDPVKKEDLAKRKTERNTVMYQEYPITKKEISSDVLHHIKEYLATTGSIHIGTIMRICRISAMEATAYYETLLTDGSINEKVESQKSVFGQKKKRKLREIKMGKKYRYFKGKENLVLHRRLRTIHVQTRI